MPKIIEAVYENGVFKLLEKVDLKEGEQTSFFTTLPAQARALNQNVPGRFLS